MKSSQTSQPRPSRSLLQPLRSSVLADRRLFSVCGAAASLLLYVAFYFLLASIENSTPSINPNVTSAIDSPSASFYDDPTLSYTIDTPITNWDDKRRDWLHHHPSFISGDHERVLMVTGSSPGPCSNPGGDHLLLRFFKNKADYCRIHGFELFYNTALFNPRMPGAWAKIPVLHAAMLAHPEAEWVWWVDSDAVLTDVEFRPPLTRYRGHNFVVPGWPDMVFVDRSWVGLNAGVFLIRNCQWSLDFMQAWASMGPQTPDFADWGRTIQAELTGKITPESDDQSALVLLLIREREKWGDKVYIENAYDLHGYWAPLVGRLGKAAEMYREMERRSPALRRRRAEKLVEGYGEMREKLLEREVEDVEKRKKKRMPFVTHFTGCQPCVGSHSPVYSSEICHDGMRLALDLADDQVLRAYGFGRVDALNGSAVVRPLPFDFPAT